MYIQCRMRVGDQCCRAYPRPHLGGGGSRGEYRPSRHRCLPFQKVNTASWWLGAIVCGLRDYRLRLINRGGYKSCASSPRSIQEEDVVMGREGDGWTGGEEGNVLGIKYVEGLY